MEMSPGNVVGCHLRSSVFHLARQKEELIGHHFIHANRKESVSQNRKDRKAFYDANGDPGDVYLQIKESRISIEKLV